MSTRFVRRTALFGYCLIIAGAGASRVRAADCAPPAPTAHSYVANGCDGTVTGGTFDTGTGNNASVLHAVNGGVLTVTGPVTLLSAGDESTGAYTNANGIIHFNAPGSTLTMQGAHSNGAHAFGTGATITGEVHITTHGESAHAVFADYGGTVQLRNSDLVTTGDGAAGIAVATGYVELLGASSISTTGFSTPAVGITSSNSNILIDGQTSRIPIHTTAIESWGAGGTSGTGTIKLRNVDVLTEGNVAFGLIADGAGIDVQTETSTVTTRGGGAVGASATRGGNLSLTSTAITTTGAFALGVVVRNTDSRAVLNGSSVTVSGAGADALRVAEEGYLSLTNSQATSTAVNGRALGLESPDDNTLQRADIVSSTLSAPNGVGIAILGGAANVTLKDSTVIADRVLEIDARPSPLLVNIDATRSTLRGAAIVAPSEGGQVHAAKLTLRDNSVWWITRDSNVTRVENFDSALRFVAPTDGVFHALTLRNYTAGHGILAVNSALGGDGSPADKLIINGGAAQGNTALQVVNVGGKGGLTSEGIRVVEVANGGNAPAGAFTLSGRAVAGAFEYGLYRGGLANPNDGNWYLRSQRVPDPPNPPGPPVPPGPPKPVYRPEVPAYIANEHAASSLFIHSLQDRMGELPFSSVPAGWLRLTGKTGESGNRDDDYSARADTVVLQGGGDFARGSLFGAADRLHVGAMLGYGHVATDGLAAGNSARARGEVNGYGAGLYATWFGQASSDLGPYVDTWFQYAWFDSNVRGDQMPKAGYHSQAWNASLETGWALPLAATAWRVEPQVQAIWIRHRGVNLTEPGGTTVNGGDTNGVVTRLGVRLFRTLDRDDGGRLQPYATLNWWHDQASTSVAFSDTILGELFPRDRYELKIGVNAKLARGWSSWGNVGGQWGSQGYRQYVMRLGARYAW